MNQHAALLARYKHLRQVGLQLNNRLMSLMPKRVIDEGGKKLAMLHKNVLALDTEDEIAVFADYCLHDVRDRGLSTIERLLEEAPPPPGSDERILLEAHRQARYSLFRVESTERGVGVHVRDLLRNEPLFLVDIGFSQTAFPGLVLASRVIAPEGIHTTTGAALPLGLLPPVALDQFLQGTTTLLKDKSIDQLSPQELSDLAATLIRACRSRGAADRVRYANVESPLEPDAAPKRLTEAARVTQSGRAARRNAPCSCGSGKKYKTCCGARR